MLQRIDSTHARATPVSTLPSPFLTSILLTGAEMWLMSLVHNLKFSQQQGQRHERVLAVVIDVPCTQVLTTSKDTLTQHQCTHACRTTQIQKDSIAACVRGVHSLRNGGLTHLGTVLF